MIVTGRGAVLANLNSAQRAPEVNVVEFCLKKLGIEVIGHIEAPGTLEGGDFFPAGRDLCFIGMGIRTNDFAIQHMMKKDMFGTRRVAVVADLFDRNQARMHLDCVANIASDNCFVVRESILGRLNPKRRVVTEYTKTETGSYEISVDGMEFGEYLALNGWNVIPASEQMADDLGINFINMGEGQLICTDSAMAETIESSPHFEGKVHVLDYREICKMYGAIHCTTQVFRKARANSDQPSTGVMPAYKALVDTTHVNVHHIPDEHSQTTNNVLLVAPTQFGQNNETLSDNDFMSRDKRFARHTDIDIITAACEEFEGLYSGLIRAGVGIKLYHHEPYHGTPDACFPNNWFSTHKTENGSDLVLYPMAHQSRRRERRPDILKFLKSRTDNVCDLTDHEDDYRYLEGTGSMVLDRTHRIAYAIISSRTNLEVLNNFCTRMGYTAHPLYTKEGVNMYHTNVMMSVGTHFAVICFEYLRSAEDVMKLQKTLKSTGKSVVPISAAQCADMCGNVLELRGSEDSFIAMSDRAYRNYRPEQLYTLLQTVDHIVHPQYDTIETVCSKSNNPKIKYPHTHSLLVGASVAPSLSSSERKRRPPFFCCAVLCK